jgi:hypothetical protein
LISGNGAHELLKAGAIVRPTARLPLVVIDRDDLGGQPAKLTGALGEVVLALLTLGGVEHLPERRLANVDVRLSG